MPHIFEKVNYTDLNSRQKENYNFLKVSALLADYGFNTLRLTDDWEGADFIANHVDGRTFLRVQLKGRLTIDKKYEQKDVYVAFCERGKWYFAPHDELVALLLKKTRIKKTKSWKHAGGYSFSRLSKEMTKSLEKYQIGGKPVATVPSSS